MSSDKDYEIVIDTAKVQEIIMPYTKIGCGSKNIVILPGLAIKATTHLAKFVEQQYKLFLDNGYTVYMFDRRTNPPKDYSIWDMAHDTVAVMKMLGVQYADIYGASQGGMMAQCIAIEYKDMVSHLLLASTASKPNDTNTEIISKWIELAKEKKEELNISCGEKIYSANVWKSVKDDFIAGYSNITDKEFENFIIMAKSIVVFDCFDRLNEIDCEVFVVGAEDDEVMSAEASYEIADELHCEIYMYEPRYGHGVYGLAPDFVDRLFAFCN